MSVALSSHGLSSRARRGRPRDPRVDETILAAALDLLGESGYARLTIEGVAVRAGVAKTTVYRRWSTKECLILDAVAKVGFAERPGVPDTGSLYEDILSYQCAWIRFRRAQAWSSEILANAELKQGFRNRLGGGLTAGFGTIIERAVARGELSAHTDVELLATVPMALVHQHYLLTGRPADEGLAQRIADQFFSPTGPSRQSRGARS